MTYSVNNAKAVVLLSGGMDSTTLLHYVVKTLGVHAVYALSLVYGQKHARELEMAAWQARAAGVTEHREVELGFMRDLLRGASALTDPDMAVPDLADLDAKQRMQPLTYVPNRNMMLLSLAVAWAEALGAGRVYYGAQAQDQYGYWDCTVDFIARINDVLALNRNTRIVVEAPFATLSKADVVRMGISLGVDYARTWSCYRGGEAPCGRCPTCVERERAFDAVNRETD